MGWESDAGAWSGLEAGSKRAKGAGRESFKSLQARGIPAGPSDGAEVEDWDLESLDLCRQHVQAVGDAICSEKLSGMRRNPLGQAFVGDPPNGDAPFAVVVEVEARLQPMRSDGLFPSRA